MAAERTGGKSRATLSQQRAAMILAKLLVGEEVADVPLDDFDSTWHGLVVAVRNRNGVSAQHCLEAELSKLPGNLQRDIRGAILAADPNGTIAPHKPRSYSAAELLSAAFPSLRWTADGLVIRPGLTLLGGAPKIGKSWFSLQLARSVGLNVDFLSKPVQGGRVLYYALEDGPSRLQARIKTAGWTGIEDVHFLFGDSLPPLDEAGMTTLEADIVAQRPAMVVLDSLAAAKTGRLDENDGGQVSELAYGLSRLATTYDVSVLLIHHHRKMTTGSPLGDLRGSGALGGAADAIMALYRERGQPECKLGLDSRDAAGGDWALGFTGCGWSLLGEASVADDKKTQRVVTKALQVLGELGGTVNDVIDAAGGIRRQDAIHALQALVDHGEANVDEIAQEGKPGRARKVYRLIS